MKFAYMICVLLGITIGSLVLADDSIVTPSSIGNKTDVTTAEPTGNATTTESTIIIPSTTTSTTTPKTTVTTTTPTPTTSSSTTPSKSTTTSKPTTTVSPCLTTSTNATITTSTPTVKTTPEATTPHPPSPSKDRHFDGLSFFGGIILATCLMAIAAFSWKFYRQCNERNYRTL